MVINLRSHAAAREGLTLRKSDVGVQVISSPSRLLGAGFPAGGGRRCGGEDAGAAAAGPAPPAAPAIAEVCAPRQPRGAFMPASTSFQAGSSDCLLGVDAHA